MENILKPGSMAMAVLLFTSLLIYSCKKDDEGNENPKENPNSESSFGLIQKKVLNTSCASPGCHASTRDASFAQHGLILTEGFAYDNLVGADPKNQTALNDGLKRVKAGDVNKSLLIHKLQCSGSGHHTANYGNRMPLGLDPLSPGQIEYIIKWVEAGAPKTGKISADEKLLDDTSEGCEEEFQPLAAPAAGTGFQMKVEPFDVKPGTEREIFIYKDLGNTEAVYINKVEVKMRTNSHHFLAYTYPDGTPSSIIPALNQLRDLRDENGNYVPSTVQQTNYQQFAFGSQTSYFQYSFPPGVGLKLPVNHKFDMNLHYVNKGTQVIQGESYMNIYKIEPAQVEHEAYGLALNNDAIYLPANKRTVVTKTFKTEETIKVFMLTSHTHKLAEKFVIKISGGARDGEVVYTNYDWHHPEFVPFSTPIELKAGEGLTMEVTYNNTTNKTVTFGLTSEDEMALIFGCYYK